MFKFTQEVSRNRGNLMYTFELWNPSNFDLRYKYAPQPLVVNNRRGW